MALIVLLSVLFLIFIGRGYYLTPVAERFYHPGYGHLKPSGIIGHGLGIFGSLFIVTGVSIYMLRKRVRFLSRLGRLQHWLEFHIFLCLLGPSLVLFHTSFKFGGLVSVSFWCMVAVVASGIMGRYIYIRIPRSIQGRELSLGEIRAMKTDLRQNLSPDRLGQEMHEMIVSAAEGSLRADQRILRHQLRSSGVPGPERSQILGMVRREITLNRRIERLQTMLNLFRYWHVAHLPFALIMLFIMVIHIVIVTVLGYTWIL